MSATGTESENWITPSHCNLVSETGIPPWSLLPWLHKTRTVFLCPAKEAGLGSLNSEHPSKVLQAEFFSQALPSQSSCCWFLGLDNYLHCLSLSLSTLLTFSSLSWMFTTVMDLLLLLTSSSFSWKRFGTPPSKLTKNLLGSSPPTTETAGQKPTTIY